MLGNLTFVSSLLLCAMMCRVTYADKPQIAQVFPYFADISAPRVITGENFDSQTRVLQWRSQEESSGPSDAIKLPDTPPEGSQSCQILDIERQVITANVSGDVIWLEGAGGFSEPYLINAAKPFWISHEKAEPGDVLHVYGFSLRAKYRECRIALKNSGKTVFASHIVPARSPRTPDPRLVYFMIPNDAPVGRYEIYIHNGCGGEYGWSKAGDVQVTSPVQIDENIVNVYDFGAKGDGISNDFGAIKSAIESVKRDGGVAFFPPGVYRTDETLIVPPGVTLRGTSMDMSMIQGFGYDPDADRAAWFTQPGVPPSAIVRLSDNTNLENLSIQGATSKGSGGKAPVEAVPSEIAIPDGGVVKNVTIKECKIAGREEESGTRRTLYRSAIFVGPNSSYINILDNDIYGSVTFNFGVTTRTEIIGNKIHGGCSSDVVALNANGIDCLIDSNLLVDTPGRMVFQPIRHCHVRYNEIHQAFRGTWANAEEMYLLHGGSGKTFGLSTSAEQSALTDTTMKWRRGEFKDKTVLITSGKGFGQYRIIVDNASDTLMLEKPWRVIPDHTSEYVVGRFFVENSYFANLNNTNCRMSLWLDCIACVVDMHRDSFAGGADLWGSDNTGRTEDGKPKSIGRVFPSYYNIFNNGWFDGSFIHLRSEAKADNLLSGPVMFGNYIVGNKVRQPHMRRTGFERKPHASGGIMVGNTSGSDMTKPQDARVALSHSVISNNLVSFTNIGVSVSDYARKTFVLNNEFQEVDKPILDWGGRTIAGSNKSIAIDERGNHNISIPDINSEREIRTDGKTGSIPMEMKVSSPIVPTPREVHVLVSQYAYCLYTGVNDSSAGEKCQSNLKNLYELIKKYEQENGKLPDATWFPEHPYDDTDSIAVILGEKSLPYLTCPTCAPDFSRAKINYLWNQQFSGKKLSEINAPANKWLMMDFVGIHKWMVEVRSCGHQGGVNILYADGSVRRGDAIDMDAWNEWAKSQ